MAQQQPTTAAAGDLRTQALERALALFWRRGAETAPYPEIVAATGLSRKALYAIWPDKNALVHEALAHYRATVLAPMLHPLAIGGRDGLIAFWDGVEAGTRRPGWGGCLLFRTASGPLRNDPFVIAAFEAHVELLQQGIERAIRKGQQDRHITADIDPTRAGWQIVALNGLLSTLGGQTGNTARVRELLDTARATCGLKAGTGAPSDRL